MRRCLLLLSLLAVACGHHHDDHGDHGDHGDHHDDHGHGHDDGELPGQAVTEWTDKSELFMEYEPLIVGRASRFLAHVTVLDGFAPVTEGQLTVTVTMAGGAELRATAEAPARAGIFIPSLTPSAAGDCRITVEVRASALTDRIDAGTCRVFPDLAAATAALGGDEGGGDGISFLKEQQWVIDFATAAAAAAELQPGVEVSGEIRAVPGREARLTAPTDGRIMLADPAPVLGAAVSKGQLLARIQPTVTASGNHGALVADVDSAEAELAAAVAQRDRLRGLVASQAVPEKRLEQAEAAVKVARARLSAARTRLASYNASASGSSRATSGAFRIKAPIAGTLVDARATAGETVKAGELLFSVIDLDRVWVTGKVFESDLAKIADASAAWFRVEGRDDLFEIGGEGGKLVTVGSVIDPKSRTVLVVYEVDNRARRLLIGQFVTITIATGKPRKALAIPESALLQDGGQWVAYVQVGGEEFARRVVRTGARSRGLVEVLSGVTEGERVVTVGAYDVKLAAAAGGEPAHGHAH